MSAQQRSMIHVKILLIWKFPSKGGANWFPLKKSQSLILVSKIRIIIEVLLLEQNASQNYT